MSVIYFINSQHVVPPFLNNEIKEASKYFDKVILISPLFKGLSKKIVLPRNTSYHFISKFFFFLNFGLCFFSKRSEFYKNDKKKAKKHGIYSFKYFYIAFREYACSQLLVKLLSKEHKKHGDGIIMSAWFDSSALAVSIFSKKNKKNVFCSFCHSFEVDRKRNDYVNFLFFDYIIPCFNKIFFISANVLSSYFTYCDETKYKVDKTKFFVRYLGIMNELNTECVRYNGSNEFLIVSCSTMNQVKRIHLIIESLKYIEFPVKWVHFGGGPLYNELRLKAEKELPSNIEWKITGFVSNKEIINFYNHYSDKISIFINVSSSEGIPVSIMESMSYGIPCLATNVGGTNELVFNDNGYLINPNLTPVEISNVIKSIDLRSETYLKKRENCRLKIYNDFNGKENAKKFYSSLINDYEKCN